MLASECRYPMELADSRIEKESKLQIRVVPAPIG